VSDHPTVEVSSREELAGWLAENHSTSRGIWLVTFKKAAGPRYLPYHAIVEEALRFGWIDSRPRKVDELRSARLLTPRKRGSNWSPVNKRRIDALRDAGLIEPAGLAAIEAAKADGSWTALDHVESPHEPDDLAAALDANPAARAFWRDSPPFFKRATLEWIATAKRPETRAKRVAATVDEAAAGRRVNEWRPKK
jgi:uncharacterized protein YdeI (YjbR/CyaY-like superfamily)